MSDIALLSVGTVLIDHFKHVNPATSDIDREERRRASAEVTIRALRSALVELCADDAMWIRNEENLEALIEYKGKQHSFRDSNPRPPRTLSPVPQIVALSARCLHLCCSLDVLAHSIPTGMLDLEPLIIYERILFPCTPDALRAVLPHVSVFSPNHEEAEAPLSEIPLSHPDGTASLAEDMEAESISFGARTVIIRAGSRAAYVLNRESALEEAAEKSKSTMGARNSFLGGLCAGQALASCVEFKAAAYGSVSASYVVQQQGLLLSSDSDGKESFNGDAPHTRFERLLMM
ncbi:hypothetical protein HDZ31DRAFT_84608 [Schizophyllum fasciatum]